jgi:hypothetical protein
LSGESQVLDEGVVQGLGVRALGRDAGQAVDPRAAEGGGVVDRPADPVLELADPIGVAGDAALAGRPIARRQVVQHLAEAALRQLLRELVLLVIVRKEVLHGAEPGAGGGRKAVEEIDLVEQHGEIGGEAGHGWAPKTNFPSSR